MRKLINLAIKKDKLIKKVNHKNGRARFIRAP